MVKNKHQRSTHWIFTGSGLGLVSLLIVLIIFIKYHVNPLNSCIGFEESVDNIRQRIICISQEQEDLIKDTEYLVQQIGEIEQGCFERGDSPLPLFEKIIARSGIQLISVVIPLHQTAKNSAPQILPNDIMHVQQSDININMIGSYGKICQFLTDLHQLSMCLSINRMSIKPGGNNEEDLVFEIEMSIPLICD